MTSPRSLWSRQSTRRLAAAELLGPHERIRCRVREQFEQTGGRGWIATLGQGMVPDIPPEAVGVYVDAVVELG